MFAHVRLSDSIFPCREHYHQDSSTLHVNLLNQRSTQGQNELIVCAIAMTFELAQKHTHHMIVADFLILHDNSE